MHPAACRVRLVVSLGALALLACNRASAPAAAKRDGAPPSSEGRATAAAAGPASEASAHRVVAREIVVPLRAPAESEIPAGPLGASIRRGRAIMLATRDSLPAYVGSRLRCLSCHLDEGRRANASPLVGVYVRYPTYSARSAAISTIEDRINDCFRRSLNGRPLPAASADLRDMVAYLAFLSRDIPGGARVEGQGLVKMTPLSGDSSRGRMIFDTVCARCHGNAGQGTAVAPPLWGRGSFNIGAGMARLRTTASFVRYNMPFDRPGSLSDQQAFDVAAYIDSRPRPDLAGKENDWPNGDAPPDVAYRTRAMMAKGTSGPRSR